MRILLLILIAALTACQSPRTATAPSTADSTPPLKPVRELRQNLIGKTRPQVIAALGKPGEVYTIPGGETWHYRNASRDTITGRTVRFMEIIFRQNKVTTIDFAY